MNNTRLFHIVALLLSLPTIYNSASHADEKKFTLSECVNKHWAHELVTFPFQAPQGRCAPDSLLLNGPGGPLAVQLAGVELWPGSQSVKSGRVTFIVDELAPLTTQTYTLTYGPRTASASTPSDLKAEAAKDGLEVVTSRFGVRLLSGQHDYDRPVAAADVPGPVRALRLADGTWFGGSRLFGPAAIQSWRSTVTDAGPVFVRVETAYRYADGTTLTVSTTLAAGDYALQFEMAVQGHQPESGWELLLNRGVSIADGVRVTGSRSFAKEMPLVLDPKSAEPACWLNPWPCESWFPTAPA